MVCLCIWKQNIMMVKYILHYVTAREADNIIKAAGAGLQGHPNEYRDLIIKPYINQTNNDDKKI